MPFVDVSNCENYFRIWIRLQKLLGKVGGWHITNRLAKQKIVSEVLNNSFLSHSKARRKNYLAVSQKRIEILSPRYPTDAIMFCPQPLEPCSAVARGDKSSIHRVICMHIAES